MPPDPSFPNANRHPEQLARDAIDRKLVRAGWQVQDKSAIDFGADLGVAVREYQTDIGPADYVLFIDGKPVGVVEAKPETWGERLTTVEEQSAGYAAARLKWIRGSAPLGFVYESTATVTRFTDGRDPDPRSREVFSFHRPETLGDWTTAPRSLIERTATWSEETPDGRWRPYTREELLSRDKASLDVFWLEDEAMTDLENLPEPDVLAEEIVEYLRAAASSFEAVTG